MSRKIATTLACAAVLLTFGAEALASQLYKGHVIKHKEWSTGNVKASFKDSFTKNPHLFKQTIGDPEYSFASVFSNATNTEGKVNTPVTVNGTHNIYFSNNTPSKQFYHYTLAICAETSQHTSQCSFYYDEIELETGGYVSVDKEPLLQVTYDKTGNYRTSISTWLMMSDGNNKNFHTTSNSEGSINIS